MDDYATHVSSKDGGSSISKYFRIFTWKFDVRETKDNYELHGELPGIDQKSIDPKNINIEFSDAQTLTIKGRTEHHREEGTPPAGLIEGEVEQGKLTQGESNNRHYHKPSVDYEGANSGWSNTPLPSHRNARLSQHCLPPVTLFFWLSLHLIFPRHR
ncbi:unnamed protein product [Zymoseptoria tritici ST99CH_3D7]|uniref:SHSP domain-containing protein n=1 Tax=Zymoseptoria tritici (strain ST99CH_3D7) TaxID=1276538 RepID=A0A1X7S9Z7_ZYMT9|nr:unnamed protein product [Zymoseptoria tritici ST99CH_3D7]